MASKRRRFRVKKIILRRTYAEVTLSSGRALKLSPYVYLKRGDTLEFSPGPTKFRTIHRVFNDRATKRAERVVVHPPYQAKEVLSLPPHVLRVTFKERTHPDEWQAAKVLEQFHYRGKGF